jgi:hypothetical protein
MAPSPHRDLARAALIVLASALTACAADEPTAPRGPTLIPAPTPTTTRARVEGYRTRGELRQGFVLDATGQPMAVTYEVHNGDAIWQGDIKLGRASEVSTTPAGAQATVVIDGDATRWPGGVMPYVIDGAVPNTGRITDAITMIESSTGGVTIVPRNGQADYIKFVTSDGCSSAIGRKGGEQTIDLGDDCTTGNAAHEMMHALGIFHEQSRCDRDDFVEILIANVESGKENNFDKECAGATDLGYNYDFGSMMHYPLDAFSSNDQPTIRLRPGITFDGTIGQRDALSVLDRFTINFLYGLNNIPPVPAIGPLAAAYNEGDEVPFDATGSTDADDKVLTYSWNFGDESCFKLPQPADCTQAKPKHRYAENGGYKVGLFVWDGYEQEATETSVTIRNAPPKVDAGGDQTLSSGQTFNLAGSFSDPGVNDSPWNWSVAWGFGTATTGSTNTQGSISASRRMCTAGTYNVVLSVTDKDAGTGTDDVKVTVGYVVVGLAIMPNANPSSVSLKKQGSLPVAILSSATFDARTIDVSSIRLGDEVGTDTPVEVVKGKPNARIDDINGDGRPDMILSFAVQQLIANGDLTSSTTSLVIRGFQGSTGDACINFRGVGAVRVVS